MQVDTLPLAGGAPGVQYSLRVWRFGTAGGGPKATIQGALHADEVPAMLVAHRLREQLAQLEAAGKLLGQVQLVPYANPLGLTQHLLGAHQGRFSFSDGTNFNRNHVDLTETVAAAVRGRLGDDEAHNVQVIRAALRDAARALVTLLPAQDLKHKLLQLAVDSDVVLDLHCDAEAAMHLYALTPHETLACELGALLGARAILLATESGDSPFDEACSRPWMLLRERFPDHPIPIACFGSTVELRGEADTSHALAQQDADAIIEFLRRRGVIAGTPAAMPALQCAPTPLAGSEPVTAPHAGIVVYRHAPGERVEAGSVVADLVDADSGAVAPILARSSGVLYARSATRWATPGKRLGKIAGTSLARTGKLLSP
jgi:uncharacterized protein